MPDSFRVDVTVGDRVAITNDGKDTIFIALISERNLLKPNVSTMYLHLRNMPQHEPTSDERGLSRNRVWMRPAAAEAWVRYLTARMVDDIYEAEGPELWPDAYDYRVDGTARDKKEFVSRTTKVSQEGRRQVKAIQMWMALGDIVGDRGFTPIFREWGRLKIDPAKPSAELRRTVPRERIGRGARGVVGRGGAAAHTGVSQGEDGHVRHAFGAIDRACA